LKFIEQYHNIKYDYIDVDLCDIEDRDEIRNHIRSLGGRLEYPTIIIDNETLIAGFHKDKLKKALEI
jgi:glutaredoxin